jgi:hypothetical protein
VAYELLDRGLHSGERKPVVKVLSSEEEHGQRHNQGWAESGQHLYTPRQYLKW